MVVAEHLDLDVAGRRDHLLDVQRAVAERRLRLGRRALRRRPGGRRAPSTTRIPLPPPPAAAFSRTGKPSSLGGRERLVRAGDALRARNERDAGLAHLGLRARLVAHPLHHLGGRPDEHEVVVLARADEVGVLGDEAVAGMNRVATRGLPPRR